MAEEGGFKVSKESRENNIAKNIDLLKKENASESVDDSMLNVAKDIDQFKTKDAGESKQGRKESHEAYKKRKEEYHKIKEEYSKKEKRFKELANKILESSANTKLEKLNAKNSSKETFYRVVKRVATEKTKSEEEVRENFNEETLIGSNDAREIRKNFEKTSAGEKSRVKIEKIEKKSSEKVEDASVDGINQVNKVDGTQEQNKTTTQDVHNFVADMILNDDAFIHDENVIKPGERMRQTFIKHLGTFVALLSEKISLNTLDKCFIATIRLEMINMRKAIDKNKRSTFDYTTDEVKKFLEEKCLEAEKEGEERRPLIFSRMEKAFDGTVKRAADEMQDSLSEQLKNICSGGTNENHNVINEINKKIDDLKYFFSKEEIENFERREGLILREARKFLENVHKEFGEISDLCAQSKYSEYINDKLEKLTKYMCDLSYRLNIRYEDVTGVTDENLIKDAKDIFLDIKRCLLEDKLENALSF